MASQKYFSYGYPFLGVYILCIFTATVIRDTSAELCSDICFFNNDGECDDGGGESVYFVCAFGTDCSDCGARPPTCGSGDEMLIIPDGGSVNITSANWPNPYPLDTYCLWKVGASSPEKRLVVIAYEFETEISHDYLSMGNGLNYTDPQSIVEHHSGSTLPNGFISTGQNVWLTFIVDHNGDNSKKGFKIEIKEYMGNDTSNENLAVSEGSLCENNCIVISYIYYYILAFDGICQDAGPSGNDFLGVRCPLGSDCHDCGPRNPNCASVYNVSSRNDVNVSSPNYPDNYDDQDYCHWLIQSSEGKRIDITFLFFQTESGYDRVSLGNGLNSKNEESVILDEVSGSTVPGPLVSCPGDGVWMNFIVDHSISIHDGIFTKFSEHDECRPGHSFGNRCYYVQKLPKIFDDAVTFCKSMCAPIVTSFDMEERDFLRNLLQSDEYKNSNYWIGAQDVEKESEWEWLDGTPVSESLWQYGVPSGGSARSDCAFMNSVYDFHLDDGGCRNTYGFICSLEEADTTPQTTKVVPTTTKKTQPLTTPTSALSTASRTTTKFITTKSEVKTTVSKTEGVPLPITDLKTSTTSRIKVTTTQTIKSITPDMLSATTKSQRFQPKSTKEQATTTAKAGQNIAGNIAGSSTAQLSSGEISGIAIVGLLLGVGVLGVFIWIMIKKRKGGETVGNADQDTIINNEFQNALYAVPEDIVLGCGHSKPADLGATGYDDHYYEEPKVNNVEIAGKNVNYEYENKIPQQGDEKVINENLYTELPEKMNLENSEC